MSLSKSQFIYFWTILIVTLVATASCVNQPMGETPPASFRVSPETEAEAVATPDRETVFAFSVTSTATPVRLVRTTYTPSPTSFVNSKDTVDVTWTPLPTLPPDQAQELIEELNETNGGCKLPCWWGMIPGVTPWDEAQQLLSTFTRSIEVSRNPGYGISVEYGILDDPRGGGFMLWLDQEERIRRIYIDQPKTKTGYRLDQFLRDYGEPDQVYIRTFTNAPSLEIPFILALFYGKKGILAQYHFDARNVNNVITACPGETEPKLDLWSEEEAWSEEMIQDEVLGYDPVIRLKVLDEVTGYRIESFVDIFSDPKNEHCIASPAEHWRWEIE